MKTKPKDSFTDFAREVIDELQQENRFATAHIYQYALKALTEYTVGEILFWNKLTKSFLRGFQDYLEKQQKSYNTVSTYLRVLRALYNRGVDRGLIKGDYHLFANLKTGIATEHKIALTATEMNRLLNKRLTRQLSPDIRRAQDELHLMLLLQGMPYTDLVHLRKADLQGDFLVCRRQKTGTELCVHLMPEALQLIDQYCSRSTTSPYLLDLLSGETNGWEEFCEYKSLLRKLNLNLARLAKHCLTSNAKVSSYTSRHTWATLAKHCHVPEEVISEGLGHSSLDVTRTYLKSFEAGELSRANRIVNSYINTGMKTVWSSGI